MVLSIGMIVKNEEKYLEQCLTALKPILDKVDSELVIADTGSTDRTVEIAKKFTDNVFYFEWIDDFAAARNSTLERSKGEWYMFIDADEILQDCSDIIRFFKTGEHKKFNSATYTVRSYFDLADKKNYVDSQHQRLVKRSDGIVFQGKVHEMFSKVFAPVRQLELIADHYGYAYTDNGVDTGVAEQKSSRNLGYLLKELEDDNIAERNPSIYNEIANSYGTARNEEKELEYVNLGLEKINHKSIVIGQYYIHKLLIFFRRQNFEGIIKTANEYFDADKHPWHNKELASDCFAYYARAYSYYSFKQYQNAIHDAAKYFDLLSKYKQNKLNTEDLIYTPFRVNADVSGIAYDVLFRCCCEERQFAFADNFTNAIALGEYLDNAEFITNHLKMRVEIMENVGYNKLDALYRLLDDRWKNFLLSLVRLRVFKAEPKKRGVIIKKLASLDGAPSELARIYRGYFENNKVDIDLVGSFLEKYGSENGEDMLLILMEQNLDITPFVRSLDFFADRAVQLSLINYNESLKVFEDYDISAISDAGLEGSIFLYSRLLFRVNERNLKISMVFEKFGGLGARWYDVAQSNRVSTYVAAALLAHDVVEAHDKRDHAQFRKAVDELKRIVSDFSPVVNAYCNEVEGDFNKVSSEFAQLAIQVKKNIRAMIEAEDFTTAWELLAEYEVLCPDDTDVELLKNEITDKM